MDASVPLILKLASEVMEYVNHNNATKYLREVIEIEMKLFEEKKKYPNCDDRLIADLMGEKEIKEQAAYQEWLIFKSKGKS